MRIKTSLLVVILLSLVSCAEKSREDLVKEWITKNAIPLKTVQAGSSFEDIEPLKNIVGDARIVSLGEPTHGNKEVFQLKHRMIEYLVEEMDFNIFALECPLGEAYDINRYVVDGIGDPEKALAGIYMWAWDTQEVLELIKWMRSYNADPNHKTKVKFYGFDTQNPERATKVMLDYINKVDLALINNVYAELGILEIPFSNPEIIGNRQWILEEGDSLSLKTIKLVMDSFDKNKTQYIKNTSVLEWEFAKQHARQVEIFIEESINDAENWSKIRDLGQAQNLKWIMDQEGDDSKMVVWAHNSHVSNSSRWGTEWMGSYMKKWYGDDLKIFGIFFNQGSFKAIDEGVPSKGMHDFLVGPAPEGTFEYVMASTNMSLAVVDLANLPKNEAVFKWFNQERLTRNSGGGFNENEAEQFYWPYNHAKAFDALIYIDSTSAVVDINDSDYDHMWLITEKQNQPTNTGFENNSPGEVPDGWVAWSKFQRLGVKMTVSDKDPYQGKHSAMIQREKGLKYGEIAANLRQYIDATPYRGKTIRLKVAAKAEIDESNFAFLRLSIDPDPLDSAHDGLPPLFDSLDKYRVDSNEWKIYEIEAQVDDKADIIHYGIYLRDFGTVWIDNVEITIIE
ncbi:erythromycin esterase family protein [uncultured Eudoraea sp.]|uniref:erythromycin esterase family protein n=1 Tax=uncultured Eudoraea sp. TaxID=1035614 RepID=UPI002635EBAD|nr:erythromycin esterase family protein [uncultured Eudoraea sp.]